MDFYFGLICVSLLALANALTVGRHNLLTTSPPTAYPQDSVFENCGFHLNATCDDTMKLFAIGVLLAESDDWKNTSVVYIPPMTGEIEIRCIDGWILGGILASSENGLITNNAWNCSSDNGTTWNNAHELGANGITSEDISSDAQWIWTDRPSWTHTKGKRHTTAICTIQLPTSMCPTSAPPPPPDCTDLFNGTTPTPTLPQTTTSIPVSGFNLNATCNNKMELFVDGNLLVTSYNWRNASQVYIPANSETIEIHCSESCWLIEGILASSDEGLITDDSWNCSSDNRITWSSAHEIVNNGLSVPDVNPDAKWISTGQKKWMDGGKVICKVTLDIQQVNPVSTTPVQTGSNVDFQLKGITGQEHVTISIGGNEKEYVLTKNWQTFSYPRPSSGSFTVEFHNDNDLRDVYIRGHESQVVDLLPKNAKTRFPHLLCGTSNENERCDWLRNGYLAWGGKYTYTLKGCEFTDKYVECVEFKDQCKTGRFSDCMNKDCARTCRCPVQMTTLPTTSTTTLTPPTTSTITSTSSTTSKSPTTSTGCSFGEEYEGNCYLLVETAKTWVDALAECNAMNGTLASVHNDEANNYLANLAGGARAWIGATDAETEGSWKWTNGDDVLFTNWTPDNPDNASGKQHCGVINYRETGKWDDDVCVGVLHPFICQGTQVANDSSESLASDFVYFIAGGDGEGGALYDTELYSPTIENLTCSITLPQLERIWRLQSTFFHNDTIYLCGNSLLAWTIGTSPENPRYSFGCMSYSGQERSWKKHTYSPSRRQVSTVILKDILYFIGGSHEWPEPRSTPLPLTDKSVWSEVPNFNYKGAYFSLVKVDEENLIIAGGIDTGHPGIYHPVHMGASLADVTQYNTRNNEVTTLPSLQHERYDHAGILAVKDNKKWMIITGGRFDTNSPKSLRTTEMLALEMEDSSWISLGDLNRERIYHSMIETEEGIMVLGGSTDSDGATSSIERLDWATKEWKVVQPSLNKPRFRYGGAVKIPASIFGCLDAEKTTTITTTTTMTTGLFSAPVKACLKHFNNEKIGTGLTLEECKQRCLSATSFICKSFDFSPPEFGSEHQHCFLSEETKDTQPGAYTEPCYIDSDTSFYIERIFNSNQMGQQRKRITTFSRRGNQAFNLPNYPGPNSPKPAEVKLEFQLKGKTGMEKVRVSVDEIKEEFDLTTEWRLFSYPLPSSGSFSVEFLNDIGYTDVFIHGHESQVKDLLPNFPTKKFLGCGTKKEDKKCGSFRDGTLMWNGNYTYTLKGQ